MRDFFNKIGTFGLIGLVFFSTAIYWLGTFYIKGEHRNDAGEWVTTEDMLGTVAWTTVVGIIFILIDKHRRKKNEH